MEKARVYYINDDIVDRDIPITVQTIYDNDEGIFNEDCCVRRLWIKNMDVTDKVKLTCDGCPNQVVGKQLCRDCRTGEVSKSDNKVCIEADVIKIINCS